MIALALWRFIVRTPWSSALAFVGLSLGVISIVSVHLVSASAVRQLEQLVPGQLAGFSHFAHRENLTASDYFDLRRRWRAGELPRIQAVAPIIDERVIIDDRLVRVIGLDLISDDLEATELVRSAQAEERPGIDASFSWQGVWVDSTLAHYAEYPVNGLINAPAGTMLADIYTAQNILGWDDGQLSYVGLRLQRSHAALSDALARLLPGFAAGLPQQHPVWPTMNGWRVLPFSDQHPAARFGESVLFNIGALSLLALLVAWFVMYQVAVSWLRRLWPVFERLHSIGVQWREMSAYFLALLGLVGLAAAGSGVLLGAWGADVLQTLAGFDDAAGVLRHVDGWLLGKALVCSLGIALLGGIQAFRRDVRPRSTSPFYLPALLAALLLGGYLLTDESTGLAGGFAVIAMLSALSGLVIVPLLQRLRAWSGHLGGPLLLRLGLREAIWYPTDLSVALGGLALSVGAAIGVSVMVDSFRSDFEDMLERRLSYDLVLRGDSSALRQAMIWVQARHPSARVQAYTTREVRVGGVAVEHASTRVDPVEAARYGFGRTLRQDELLISEQMARALKLQLGQSVRIDKAAYTVAGIFQGFGDVRPRIVSTVADTESVVGRLNSVGISSPQASLLGRSLRQQFSAVTVEAQGEVRQRALQIFDRTFAITRVLIWLALLVAAVGVYIAVSSMRLNRRADGQLLHTLGLSRGEKLGMDVLLGGGIGAVAGGIALPLGLAIAWILCVVINPRGFGWSVGMQLQPWAIAQPLLWGMLAAVGAGVLRTGQNEEGVYGNGR